jgi:outer membrane protein OmpA-like peptidoglycan-associated protein/tetratricopeptide (TPR) repeat protein
MRVLQNLLIVSLLVTASACEFTYKIKSGDEAYEVKQYAVASEMLAEEYNESNNPQVRAQRAFMLARSYEHMNNPKEAAVWFQIAAQEGYGDEAMVKYAENLAGTQRYEEAIEVYRQLMAKSGDGILYRPRITAVNQAMQWLRDADKSEYKIGTVTFNSSSSDFAPYVLGPNVVLFTSDRENGGGEAYNWTGRSFSDIYVAHTDANTVESFDAAINSKHNDGTITFTGDRNQMYFSRCFQGAGQYDSYCKLMTSVKQGGSWTDPVELPFLKDGVNYAHPVLSANDSLMIFSSNDPGGAGGYDLYYTKLTIDGWADPVILSGRINTPGDEMYPSLHNDTLYFSSDRHSTMGGLDIFKSYVSFSGEWTPAYNLKAPINSGWDDFGFVVDTFSPLRGNIIQQGYFSSSRDNGDGSDDIYTFSRAMTEETADDEIVVADADAEDEKIRYELYLAIRVMEPIFADHKDPNSERTGKRPLVRARVNIEEGDMAQTFRTDEDGYLIMSIDWESIYHIQAKFSGFLSKRVDFNANVLEKDPEEPVKTHNLVIVLDPIFKGKEILLENIYYDLDKWDIRDDAEPSLNGLVAILKDNPGIKIELGSHTDCRADDAYNIELSQKRAQSAVDYLISKRIDGSRLRAVGYGETQFAVDCECSHCTEAEHQANRRTTFKIVQ